MFKVFYQPVCSHVYHRLFLGILAVSCHRYVLGSSQLDSSSVP